MRPLDWRGLLTEHGVRFVERGPNVKRGEINIRCPFCGAADPSHHMGLNLESGYWACWRNSNHRGKSPVRLLAQLLNLPYWKARRLAGLEDREVDPDGFDAVAARLLGRDTGMPTEHIHRRFLRYPDEFKELASAPDPYWRYLRDNRAFGEDGTRALARDYDVRYVVRGPYRGRIVLPYFMDGHLVAWTARAIGPAEVRYRDLELDQCLVPIKQTLFNLDCREGGGRVLVVVEGPIDALKLDVFGRRFGVRAVALSTNSLSEEQTFLLEEASQEFDRLLVMMDAKTDFGAVDSMTMRAQLRTIPNASIVPVPYGLGDAGELRPRQATRWAQEITA